MTASSGALLGRLALVDTVDHLLKRGAVITGEATISVAGVDLVYLGVKVLLSSVENLPFSLDATPGGRTASAVGTTPAPQPVAPGGPAGPIVRQARGTERTQDVTSLASSPGGTDVWGGIRTSESHGIGAPDLQNSGELQDERLRDAPPIPLAAAGEAPPDEAPGVSGVAIGGESTSPGQGLAQLVLTLVELLRQVVERQAIHRMERGSLTDEEVERMGQALADLQEKMTEIREAFGLRPEDLDLDLGPLGNLA